MPTVYIGIGSNLGDRHDNIQKSLALLSENKIELLRCSSIIETTPIGGPKQNNYFNAVIKVSTHHAPQALLKILQSIENKLGRVKTIRNGPRTIDLDILLYDDIILETKELTIPHPRMHQRNFVLTPLNEIAPHLLGELLNAKN